VLIDFIGSPLWLQVGEPFCVCPAKLTHGIAFWGREWEWKNRKFLLANIGKKCFNRINIIQAGCYFLGKTELLEQSI